MKFVIFALVALFSSYAFAEEASLNKFKSLKCEFPTSASNNWQKDAPVPKVEKGQKFAFHIDWARGTWFSSLTYLSSE